MQRKRVPSSTVRNSQALAGIATLAIYYTMRTTVEILGDKGFASAVSAPWVILAAFGGYGVWQLCRVPR